MSRRAAPCLILLAMLPLSACSCDEEGARISSDPDGSSTDLDGSPGLDGEAPGDGDGSTSDLDGAAPLDPDGSTSNLDGAVGGTDGGNPLEQSLEDFCRGQGSVVSVGGEGGVRCAGQVAEDTFQFALCACDSINAQSTLELDAFDSRLGVYGATLAAGLNLRDDGHLGINGALRMDGKLTVRGSAFIGGGGFAVGAQSRVFTNLYANGSAVQANSSSSVGRNAYINGDVEGRFQIGGDLTLPASAALSADTASRVAGRVIRRAVQANAPCPCAADEILDVGAITAFGRGRNDNAVRGVLTSTTYAAGGPATLRLPCGRYYLTEIQQPGGLQIIAEGRTVLFVDGDMNIGGGFSLQLAPGAEVDLFIKGVLSVGASANFGDSTAPSKVRTYVGGAGTITLSASAEFGGNLYAPRADVVFSASANLYGALFARSVSFSGSANVHFDSAIRGAGDVCEAPVPGSDGGVGDGAAGDASGGAADASGGAADASGSGVDASSSSDAGNMETACSGCGQCGDLACLINEGEATGTCGACSNDLDCCAPYACLGGVCTIRL